MGIDGGVSSSGQGSIVGAMLGGVDQVGYFGEVVRAVCSYRAALVQRQKSSGGEVQDEAGQ